MENRTMSAAQAKTWSRQLVEIGYADWLISELKKHAEQRFISTNISDVEELKGAKMLYESAALVNSIVRDNAR